MNLEQIAKLSGVSRSTVSRVINHDPRVGPATREKVLQVMQSLEVKPQPIGRKNAIGLVVPLSVSTLFTDPYFPILIQGVSAACHTQQYTALLWLAEPEVERSQIRKFIYGGSIEGVIVAAMVLDDALVQTLADSDVPFVLVGRHPAHLQASYVDTDNLSGARDAVQHLLRSGRNRIATITGLQSRIAGADRLAGYTAALRARGIIPDPALIVDGDFSETGGYRAMQQLLPRQPDAVFAASDTMALGALRAIRDAGLRVPEDIAVAGFDDLPLAEHTTPPLTTIRQPIYRLGTMAAETLIEQIEHPHGAPHRVVLPTELVIRASCGSSLST
jgi:LacI family transcriptional regulator